MALSVIRTLKSIPGSLLSLPQLDVPAQPRHLSSHVATRLPVQHCPVRRSWQLGSEKGLIMRAQIRDSRFDFLKCAHFFPVRLVSGPFIDPSFHLLVRDDVTLVNISFGFAHRSEKCNFIGGVAIVDIVG